MPMKTRKLASGAILSAALACASMIGAAGSPSCGGSGAPPPEQPVALYPYQQPLTAQPVTATAADPAAAAQPAGGDMFDTMPPEPAPAPAMPPKPDGKACVAWTPKDYVKEADLLTSEVKDKGIGALGQLSCKTGVKNPPPCDLTSCEACVMYLSYDALVGYQQFEVERALEEALLAGKTGRECGLTGRPMARAYVGLGYLLADAKGEMVKASNAFRWGILHEWEVALPFPAPPPAVDMTFKAAKSSMGKNQLSCAQ